MTFPYVSGEVAVLLKDSMIRSIALALRNHLVQTASMRTPDAKTHMAFYSSIQFHIALDVLDPESPSFDKELVFQAYHSGMEAIERISPL